MAESWRISVSGVVLRGSDREQTVLLKKGVDRGALLYIEGRQALMKFPSVKIGPGKSSRSHTADEYIMVSEIDTELRGKTVSCKVTSTC